MASLRKVLKHARRVASIRIMAVHKTIADEVAEAIREEAPNHGCLASGIIRLPTHIDRHNVNRSVFVNKKSQEHYEMRRHKRLVDIYAVDGSRPEGLVHALVARPPMATQLSVHMFWEESFTHNRLPLLQEPVAND